MTKPYKPSQYDYCVRLVHTRGSAGKKIKDGRSGASVAAHLRRVAVAAKAAGRLGESRWLLNAADCLDESEWEAAKVELPKK